MSRGNLNLLSRSLRPDGWSMDLLLPSWFENQQQSGCARVGIWDFWPTGMNPHPDYQETLSSRPSAGPGETEHRRVQTNGRRLCFQRLMLLFIRITRTPGLSLAFHTEAPQGAGLTGAPSLPESSPQPDTQSFSPGKQVLFQKDGETLRRTVEKDVRGLPGPHNLSLESSTNLWVLCALPVSQPASCSPPFLKFFSI